jgi:uncharacterized membrane protein
MEKKNPLLAGLFNMLVPGSAYWYVDRDRERFLKTLVIGVAAIAVVIVVATLIQSTTGYPLPQGICMGILLLFVLVPLFQRGQRTAYHHNFVLDNASMYTARQHGSNESKIAKNQDLRDKGYISKQEYDSRKDDINKK